MLCGMMAINIRKALRKAFKQAKPVVPAAEPHPAKVVRSLLFVPGDGQMPLHVAGRAREMDVLRQILGALQEGDSPAHNAALHAPRGLGKSVLLEKLRREAEADGQVRVVFKSASEIAQLGSLYAATLGAPAPTGEQAIKSTDAHAGAAGMSAGGSWSQTTQFAGMDPSGWREALTAQCERQPMLLLIDEAHTMNLEVAHVLLNASQHLRRNAPFALVVAGTPGLESHLAKAETTFWERLDEGDLSLGLLSMSEAEDALRTPLMDDARGLPFDEDTITAMAQRSDGYPYFVQLWGEQAELRSRRNGNARITMETVRAIESEATRLRNNIYEKRWEEMRRMGLLEAMERLAPHLSEPGSSMRRTQAEGVLAQESAVDSAILLGALQTGPSVGTVQAGIPSMMEFIAAQAQENAPTETTGRQKAQD